MTGGGCTIRIYVLRVFAPCCNRPRPLATQQEEA